MKRTGLILLLLTFGILSGCDDIVSVDDDDDDDSDDPFEQVAEQVTAMLGDEVQAFVIVDLDVAQRAGELTQGQVHLPFLDPDTQLVELDLQAADVQLRAEGVTTGGFRSGSVDDPNIEEVSLPPEQNYTIGNCLALQEQQEQEFESCGAVTVMDEAQTMLRGMVLDARIGLAFIEPVDLILDGRNYPDLHILYNVEHTPPVVFAEDEEPEYDESQNMDSFQRQGAINQQSGLVQKWVEVVLDGDVEFYEIDPETVWSRQESILNMVRIIYGLIEPLSSNTWQLIPEIKGQEVWIAGGPTTTNKVDLTNELEDPNYYLIHPVTDEDLHLFFPGYNVSGVYGRASGIGNTSGFGGGSGKNHAYSEALQSQSFKTKWVVAAHELGHLIGGLHSQGALSGCAGGLLNNICGPSIMPAGSAGGPETRKPYFSDDNDSRIADVIDAVLP